MAPNKIHSTYKCTLTALSPVHVGSGEQYKKGLDFIIKGKRVYILSKDRLIKKAAEAGPKSVDRLTEAIENGELEDWLGKNKVSLSEISKASYSVSEPFIREIHVQLRTGTGKPLIPGSSVKGAFRTALLFAMSQRDGGKTVKEAVIRLMTQDKVRHKFADQAIIKKFLGRDPKFNLMRSLAVADFSMIAGNMALPVTYVYSLRNDRLQRKQIKGNKNTFDMKLFPEVITEGAKAEGQISFDDYLIENAAGNKGFSSFDRTRLSLSFLINATRAKTAAAIDKEIDFLSSHAGNNNDVSSALAFYQNLKKKHEKLEDNEVILQMGWGTGWRGMTGPLLEDEDLTDDVREKLNLAPKRTHFPFPKTRKVAFTSEGQWPLGWIKIRFVDKEKIREKERIELKERMENERFPWRRPLEGALKTADFIKLRKKLLEDENMSRWLEEIEEVKKQVYNKLKGLLRETKIHDWGSLKQQVLDNDLFTIWQGDNEIAKSVFNMAKHIKERSKKWTEERDREIADWLKKAGIAWKKAHDKEKELSPDDKELINKIDELTSWGEFKQLGLSLESLSRPVLLRLRGKFLEWGCNNKNAKKKQKECMEAVKQVYF